MHPAALPLSLSLATDVERRWPLELGSVPRAALLLGLRGPEVPGLVLLLRMRAQEEALRNEGGTRDGGLPGDSSL